ncbi:lytic murein transglycosylase [Antrihabitans sp. YC2-6]|uniref:lytic transglycosylase domain-containing protein n=1 Tax=Antrihabitans sp. YC2-6 TaxID=2799498 RepID=UPI0018F42148|nr:lytic murein transglycosylase [Antrihabitans sp. YC2-6]MBJ8345146.1 lytic murein transglycosylase [Antrihabitans sp. YC2-6]
MRLKGSGLACGIVAAVLTTGATASGALTPSEHPNDIVAEAKTSSLLPSPRAFGLVQSKTRPAPALRAISREPISSSENRVRRLTQISAEVPAPTPNAIGIPEIVLAAYRNAELAMAATQPGCGITWDLLAGIGRIESGHASGGNTSSDGTTVTPILGPALDGTLPGNEVIRADDSSYVRAVGPMQFLPSTWAHYAADGNGDGAADPNNIYDAALGAAQYLCSGGLDLRDPAAELRAVLRYNNSTSYASDVLSWSATYSGGGAHPIEVALPAPTEDAGPVVTEVAESNTPAETPGPTTEPAAPAPPPPPMINIPGLPPIPCGIFCPPPPQ